MVRVSACHAEGREFESRLSRHLIFFLKKGLTVAKLSAILVIMKKNDLNRIEDAIYDMGGANADQVARVSSTLEKLTDQISISNGYTDDVRKELSDLNKTLMLIAQILRNK